jgi:hypothetical protein
MVLPAEEEIENDFFLFPEEEMDEDSLIANPYNELKDGGNYKYYRHQIQVYHSTYGDEAFRAEDAETFCKSVKRRLQTEDPRDRTARKLMSLATTKNLSRDSIDGIIDIIKVA